MRREVLRNVLPLVLGTALAAGCAMKEKKPDIPAAVTELRPGIPSGYLPISTLPHSLSLLPPPPAPGSADLAADEDAYRRTRALRGTPRFAQATQDAELRFPQSAQNFSCALNAPITQEVTPHLYMLLKRSATDGALSTYSAKEHYQRARPFAAHNEATCTPQDDATLRNVGSYPSGHATLGWTWALILAEVAPDRSDAVLARGLSFGQSRVICGAHWQSDVTAARVMGASTVARLHGDPTFRAELEEAKKEVVAAGQKAMKPARNCSAEAAALAQR